MFVIVICDFDQNEITKVIGIFSSNDEAHAYVKEHNLDYTLDDVSWSIEQVEDK